MNLPIPRSALLVVAFLAVVDSASGATPAERLLTHARAGKPPAAAQVLRDASALFAHLNVPGWMRQDESINLWEVASLPAGSRLPELMYQIVVVNGPVTIGRARYGIVIASGDVTVESGAALLVVTDRSIRFAHDPDMDWSGVFVARGRMTAPWVGNAVVHAAAGLGLSESSVNVMTVDTAVQGTAGVVAEHRAAGPIFSDSKQPSAPPEAIRPKPELPYAGKRCANGPSLREIGQHVPRVARDKARCDGPVSLLIASCVKSGPSFSEELWTVHLCTNVIAEVTARRTGERNEFSYYSRLPPDPVRPPPSTDPNAPRTYGVKPSPR